MKPRFARVALAALLAAIFSAPTAADEAAQPAKPVVYQVFTRLFGNTKTTNAPWGTIEENGVGKFADFTDAALAGIRELGVTHIWYTGVPQHAVIRDYTDYGLAPDDPDVVKGRAGSPYAVRDYYSVNPDLAVDPARRLEEFEALIARTHAHGMKVIIDIVPNHVARSYRSTAKPDGVEDFGSGDDTSVVYARGNDFYYVPGRDFEVPEWPDGYAPLGGAPHPLADGAFDESPAKWTGNGARAAQPKFDDWYETVKLNYGVRPDGSYDFARLPDEARAWSLAEHAGFWQGNDVPSTWEKFRDIALYWTAKGVDGFRYDMAEMVPVEFWSYLNASIKAANPDAFLLAEIYNPARYRDYLELGRMDYLYDKVGLYDTLRRVMTAGAPVRSIADVHAGVLDIEAQMLHFLENHDEQRVASPGFAGDADRGRPAMTVSALIGRSPTMIYFGQEVGERAEGDPGFGNPTRTTIFDYWGVPAHQRWMNGGRFDGGALSADERSLRDFYARLLMLSRDDPAMRGAYAPLETQRAGSDRADERVFAFARWHGDAHRIVVANFDDTKRSVDIELPAAVVSAIGLDDGRYPLTDGLFGAVGSVLVIDDGVGRLQTALAPLGSLVLGPEPGAR